MKTTAFNPEIAEMIEGSICEQFGIGIGEIWGFADTFGKKVVVFILYKYFGFDKRILARRYQMTYLYVPTVALEMEHMEKVVALFKVKISLILNQLSCEAKMD